MKKLIISLSLCLLFACSTPPTPQEDDKILLSSHDPLTDAQLARAVEMLGDFGTNEDVQRYLFDRLSTEEYRRFEEPLLAKHEEIGSAFNGVPQPIFVKSVKKRQELQAKVYIEQLGNFHQAKLGELAYIRRMLDFMELPIPYARKINGLKNIERVMAASETHHDLNVPEMKDVRKRLYDLALSEKSPDNVRRELAAWLREMR